METGHSIVFYSWQSDLPNRTNRGFIEEALKRAVKAIQNDESIVAAPRVESDTAGIPGSPDISRTIFEKIDQADVFVCDVSFINITSHNERRDRPTPNPNVLVELGYALRALGYDRVIMVFNEAYGKRELLPFDLRPRRVLSYTMPDEAGDRATERKRLEGQLTEAIRTILRKLSTPKPGEIIELKPLTEQIRLAAESAQSSQTALCRQYMKNLAERITALAPQLPVQQAELWDELLSQSLRDSTKIVLEFIEFMNNIALIETSQKAAIALYKGFANVLDLYTSPPSSVAVQHIVRERDFAKFLGHELFVVFFSSLIQEEKWDLIAELLDEDLYARVQEFGNPTNAPFTLLSRPIDLLEYRNNRLKLNRLSLHADLLEERYTRGELKDALPFEYFMAADYFLYLRSESLLQEPSPWPSWIPWSTLYMKRLPHYLYKAERRKYANQLLAPLAIQDIPSLGAQLKEATEKWSGFWSRPRHIEPFNFNQIGSR